METRKTKLGVDHLDMLTSINNLAVTWKGSGKETEAISLIEECIRLGKGVLGLNYLYYILSCITLDIWKAEQEDIILLVYSPIDR